MLHPPIVHFAIVLPLVGLIFGLVFLIKPSELMSKISSRVIVFAAIFMVAAWYTGGQEGPEIWDYLDESGQEALKAHKTLGLYVMLATVIAALMKVIGCMVKKVAFEAAAVILLAGTVAATFYQGKIGGEIVYEHGKPFQVVSIQETLSDALEELEDAEDDEEKLELLQEAIDESLGREEE
ncbi:MAG: DUF2231 domain-containing protein [Campylobacterota bacterium]|nr:DUF2231 domain-containing protein [Campylobacterota bacterium]